MKIFSINHDFTQNLNHDFTQNGFNQLRWPNKSGQPFSATFENSLGGVRFLMEFKFPQRGIWYSYHFVPHLPWIRSHPNHSVQQLRSRYIFIWYAYMSRAQESQMYPAIIKKMFEWTQQLSNIFKSNRSRHSNSFLAQGNSTKTQDALLRHPTGKPWHFVGTIINNNFRKGICSHFCKK